MKDTLLLALQLLSPLATGLTGWIIGRKKSMAETESIELANFDRAIGIYREIAEDMQDRMEGLSKEMDIMRKQNKELMNKLDQAHRENAILKVKIESLEEQISSLKNKI